MQLVTDCLYKLNHQLDLSQSQYIIQHKDTLCCSKVIHRKVLLTVNCHTLSSKEGSTTVVLNFLRRGQLEYGNFFLVQK